jgi:hypothetical protein
MNLDSIMRTKVILAGMGYNCRRVADSQESIAEDGSRSDSMTCRLPRKMTFQASSCSQYSSCCRACSSIHLAGLTEHALVVLAQHFPSCRFAPAEPSSIRHVSWQAPPCLRAAFLQHRPLLPCMSRASSESQISTGCERLQAAK